MKWKWFHKFLSSKKENPFYFPAGWLGLLIQRFKPLLGMQSRTVESQLTKRFRVNVSWFFKLQIIYILLIYYFSEAVSVLLPKDGWKENHTRLHCWWGVCSQFVYVAGAVPHTENLRGGACMLLLIIMFLANNYYSCIKITNVTSCDRTYRTRRK